MLSDEAKHALNQAKFSPASTANAIASLAPILSDNGNKIASQAHVTAPENVANLAPALSADLNKFFGQAVADPVPAPTIVSLASPFQAAADKTVASNVAGPLEAEALGSLAHATSEKISSEGVPNEAGTEAVACANPGAVATAMHTDISAQVSKGTLSKEGALAAHAALYNVISPSIPKLTI